MFFRKQAFGALSLLVSSLAAIALAGCAATGEPDGQMLGQVAADTTGSVTTATTATVEEPGSVKYYPSDEPFRLGREHFNRGNYGIAERYFRDAVEKTPRDVSAWVGLAASYDRLSRFDLADRAYAFAIKLAGETPQILNNQGYSYILRGDLVRARQKLLKAQARDPNNPTIANNLHLLDSSRQFVKRVEN